MIWAWSSVVGVKCGQEKLGKTGFEFSDKLAPGGGDALLHGKTLIYVLPALRIISWEHGGEGCDNERRVILTSLGRSASQSKSNPLPSMASSDLRYQIRIQTQTQITRVTHYPRSLARSQWQANLAQVEEEGPLQCQCLCPCQRQPHQPRPQVSRSHVWFNPLELRIIPILTPAALLSESKQGRKHHWSVVSQPIA